MVWITMSLAPHAGSKKRKKNDSKPHSQINKCLNEKRRREQENIHIEELAELLSASPSDMSSLSCKPDKCAILKETVNQIRSQKQSTESDLCDDLQQSEVSSSKPNIINNQIFGSILLEALEGFLFVVNIDGKVEFVSENIVSFLNYQQEEVFEKNIYDFIHPDDRARFNSNLLLMMPIGDGCDWSPESNFNSSNKPTKHFNCRFLVRPDESEIKMENKQPRGPQYENLNITANYIPLGDEGNESKNGLTCIARRVAIEDKRVGVSKVEQFTTRIDREGKVVDIDIGMLSPTNDQYLRKELLGSAMLDFCHPGDLPTFKQHLKETLENGVSTCSPFKFRIGRDKYAKVKTKSKRFQNVQGAGEFIISTHSIIRDSDCSSTLESHKNISSPSSVASTSSGPGSVSDSSTSVNGSVTLSPLALSSSYGSLSSSTPQNSTDFRLGDLVLDMFPSSSWSLDQNSPHMKENDNAAGFVSSPLAVVPSSSRSSDTSAASSPTSNAFVSSLTSNRTGSSAPSPVVQSRTPTPYGGNCYSPSASQSSNGRNSPARSTLPVSDNNNLNQALRQDRQFDAKSNQKLRNLLTQSGEESSSRLFPRQSSQDEVTVIGETRFEDTLSNVREPTNAPKPTTSNVILRDLLNQDDDEEVPLEPIYKPDVSVPNPLLNAGACKTTESSAQQRLGNNNMLRKLLNDDADRSYRKSQDIIHKLLIEGAGNRTSFQNDNRIPNVSSPHIMDQSVPKSVSVDSFRGSPDVSFLSESTAVKRKIVEKPPNVSVKRHGGPHAHLAGQNPMLASMLAQTPRTPPSVPTSVASSIMTQLPQERLPKNLEKKLVHTPYTGVNVSGTHTATSSQAFQNLLTTVTNQKDIVTSDTRGHVLHTSQQIQLQSGFKNFPQQQQQGIIDKLLACGNDNLARQLALSFPSSSIAQNPPTYVHQVSQLSDNILGSSSLLTDPVLIDTELSDTTAQTNQASSDPALADLLEQIYSLQEEHNLQTCTADDRATILKILGEVMDSPQANTVAQPASSTSTEDLNEKRAISAIQKELMEGVSLAITGRATPQNIAGVSTYSQAGRPGTQVSGTQVLQTQLTTEQILLLQHQQQQQQLLAGSLPPNYNLITNRVRLPSTTQSQLSSNPELLAQAQRRGIQIVRNTYVNLGNANVRKNMKQKLYLQQQQKRLLEVQQKQQLTMQTQQPIDVINSTGTNSFPENMNDLLNNTVAPNVTLMRSSGIPEVPGSARFNLSLSNPVLSPSNRTSPSPQLSPGQRITPRSPFSPLSQQAFQSQTPSPNPYQAAGLSPHAPPSYSQGGPSQSPLPIPPTSSPHVVISPQPSNATSPQWNQQLTTSPIPNLQLQNPMLNAQLSQAPLVSNQQVRLTAQQRQQLALRSMSNSVSLQSSLQSTRSSTITSQSEATFSPLSPIMVLQSQAQQRVQRANSLSDRISGVSQGQSNFTSSESVLSPQSLPSPSFIASSTSATSVSSIPSSPVVPLSFSVSQNNQHFSFDRQNIQTFANSSNEMNMGSPANAPGTSDIARAVGSRNQIGLSSANVLQSISSSSNNTRVLNVQNLSRETLEELGLPMELLSGTDAQSSTQTLYSQALLNVSNSLENTSQQPIAASPRVQIEEPRPADRKKSLLQQLLSEPT